MLNAHLKAQPYLVGSSFSVADLNLAGVMSRALAMDFAATPGVGEWLRRCLERPAALKVRKLRDG